MPLPTLPRGLQAVLGGEKPGWLAPGCAPLNGARTRRQAAVVSRSRSFAGERAAAAAYRRIRLPGDGDSQRPKRNTAGLARTATPLPYRTAARCLDCLHGAVFFTSVETQHLPKLPRLRRLAGCRVPTESAGNPALQPSACRRPGAPPAITVACAPDASAPSRPRRRPRRRGAPGGRLRRRVRGRRSSRRDRAPARRGGLHGAPAVGRRALGDPPRDRRAARPRRDAGARSPAPPPGPTEPALASAPSRSSPRGLARSCSGSTIATSTSESRSASWTTAAPGSASLPRASGSTARSAATSSVLWSVGAAGIPVIFARPPDRASRKGGERSADSGTSSLVHLRPSQCARVHA
jgi:hypothetical protein